MRKYLIIVVLLILGATKVSAQTDTFSATQKQYNNFKYLWDEHAPNFDLDFPFELEDFDQPMLFKNYSQNSMAAYGSSIFLLPDWQNIRKTDENIDPLSHFLYKSNDSQIRFKPQEVFCFYNLNEATDSIESFADNIKALVIPTSFSHLARNGGLGKLRKVLDAFKNVIYLELGDINNSVSTEYVMGLVLQNKSFDQLEYLYVNYITMEQTIQIHERYQKLKSLIIRGRENQDETPLPNPFLNCLDVSLLFMPLYSETVSGTTFSHLTKLETLLLRDGPVPFTDESLAPLTHLNYLSFETREDTILFKNEQLKLLDLHISGDHNAPFIRIDAPSLKRLSIQTYVEEDTKVELLNMGDLTSLDIIVLTTLNLKLISQMKSLREVSIHATVLDFYSRYRISKKLITYWQESLKINYRQGSKKFP